MFSALETMPSSWAFSITTSSAPLGQPPWGIRSAKQIDMYFVSDHWQQGWALACKLEPRPSVLLRKHEASPCMQTPGERAQAKVTQQVQGSHTWNPGAEPSPPRYTPPTPAPAPGLVCVGWTSFLGVCQRLELNEVDADLISRKASLGILRYNDNHHS